MLEVIHDDGSDVTSNRNIEPNSEELENAKLSAHKENFSTTQLKDAINCIRNAFILENPAALFFMHPVMDEVYKIIKSREKNTKINDFFDKK